MTVGDTSVPAVGLGTWRLRGGDCRRAVRTALDLGYRHVDTAQVFGFELMPGEMERIGRPPKLRTAAGFVRSRLP